METRQGKQALLEYEWSPIFIATNALCMVRMPIGYAIYTLLPAVRIKR